MPPLSVQKSPRITSRLRALRVQKPLRKGLQFLRTTRSPPNAHQDSGPRYHPCQPSDPQRSSPNLPQRQHFPVQSLMPKSNEIRFGNKSIHLSSPSSRPRKICAVSSIPYQAQFSALDFAWIDLEFELSPFLIHLSWYQG